MVLAASHLGVSFLVLVLHPATPVTTAEGQFKDDRGAYRPLAALRAAIIVTATAAFFVIATRHIDLSPPASG